MVNELVKWITNLIPEFVKFGAWLTTPLQYVNLSPLALLGFTGLTIIIGYLLARLVIGG